MTNSYGEAIQGALEYFNGDDLSAKVFVDKYALRDHTGGFVETSPEQMHRRLAKEFARIESKYPNPMSEEEVFDLLDGFKYVVPQGSPMSAVGNKYKLQSASNCFVKGTKVHVSSGIKNIEDVEVGDRVVTHEGRLQRVAQVHRNKVGDRKAYKLKCFRTPSISVTDNHKMMSISKEQLEWGQRPQWNSVEYLRVGDYVQIPNNKDPGSAPSFDFSKLFQDTFEYGKRKYEVERKKDAIRLVTITSNDKRHPHSHFIPSKWIADEDLAYFLGLWYGDGCVFDENDTIGKQNKRNRRTSTCSLVRGITFTFGSKEQDLIDFVTSFLGKKGIPCDVNLNDGIDGTTQIVVHSSLMGYAFEKLFGRRFDGKRLHSSMFNWPESLAHKLAQGIVDSDGTVTKVGDVRVVLANKRLVCELYHLLRSRNILVGKSESSNMARLDFGRNEMFRKNSNKTYEDSRLTGDSSSRAHHTIEIDGKTFVEIRKKTPLSLNPFDYVYTFGVANDHSYSVEGLIAMNCFVLESPHDSYGGILKTDQELVQIAKRRGGIGFDISNIRPRGLPTSNAAGTTDGIGIFMERFSNSCREVAQNGRRGALLLSISCHHPEIETFIAIKKDLRRVTGANISVRWTDEFLSAVEENRDAQLRWPVDDRESPEISGMVNAAEIWAKFVDAAHASGEPGCLFWDRATERTPSDIYADEGFGSTSTNPCGEIILSPNDSCRLILMNTLSFVNDPYSNNAEFDFEKFESYVVKAQRLMDDLVDIEIEAVDRIIEKIKKDPEPNDVKEIELALWKKIRDAAVRGRRTGLGVNAIGDTVAALGLKYGSKDSIRVVEAIYRSLALGAYRSSCILAKERGSFEVYDYDKERGHPFIEQIFKADPELADLHRKHGRRNIALTTTAPSGSVSILTQTTSGIEPVFALEYKRRKKVNPSDSNVRVDFVDDVGDSWQEFTVYHKGVERWMGATGEKDFEKSPYYGATANEIDWVSAVDLQAAAQKWVCHAISKTTNLPNDVSIDQVHEVYWHGWKAGLKGITVYRDGCRSGVLVTEDTVKTDSKGRPVEIIPSHAPKRPEDIPCEIFHAQVKGVRWTILLGLLRGQPYEIFVGHSEDLSLPDRCKAGRIVKRKRGWYDLYVDIGDGDQIIVKNIIKTFSNSDSAWATRLISVALRHGAPIDFVVEQLQKDGTIGDINRVVARLLKKYIKDGQQVRSGHSCQDCGSSNLIYEEGCLRCIDCGSSKCG